MQNMHINDSEQLLQSLNTYSSLIYDASITHENYIRNI